jgi:hypothetical protein
MVLTYENVETSVSLEDSIPAAKAYLCRVHLEGGSSTANKS